MATASASQAPRRGSGTQRACRPHKHRTTVGGPVANASGLDQGGMWSVAASSRTLFMDMEVLIPFHVSQILVSNCFVPQRYKT